MCHFNKFPLNSMYVYNHTHSHIYVVTHKVYVYRDIDTNV